MIVMNVYGHLGFEILPKGYARHWFFRWSASATHHNMHHTKIQANYGFYFTWWDRLMKTNHRDYEDQYDQVMKAKRISKRSFRRKMRLT